MLTNHALGVNDCGQSRREGCLFTKVSVSYPRRSFIFSKMYLAACTAWRKSTAERGRGYFLTRAVRPTRPAKPKRSNAAEPGSGVESNPGTVATKLSTSTLPVGEATVM